MAQEWVETLTKRTRAFLESNYDVEVIEFIAFGSVASGEFCPGESDLDLIVVVEMDEAESAFFMSESTKQHVSVEGTPAVGVDTVVTPIEDLARAKAMFEHTKPVEELF